jgi:hypothetical protein
MERFTGVLIEHFGGKFPTGSAPNRCASSRSPTSRTLSRKRCSTPQGHRRARDG